MGALINHAQVQFAPPQRLLDDLTAFQNVLFSSRGVRALSDALRTGATTLPDADPPLNALERQGKVVSTRACGQCHGGPGQSTSVAPAIRFHDINTQCPRPVDTAPTAQFVFKPCGASLARNVRTYQITLTAGPKVGTTERRTSSDPGCALLSGYVGGAAATDDWNKFDVPSVRGISKTAPYFQAGRACGTLQKLARTKNSGPCVASRMKPFGLLFLTSSRVCVLS